MSAADVGPPQQTAAIGLERWSRLLVVGLGSFG